MTMVSYQVVNGQPYEEVSENEDVDGCVPGSTVDSCSQGGSDQSKVFAVYSVISLYLVPNGCSVIRSEFHDNRKKNFIVYNSYTVYNCSVVLFDSTVFCNTNLELQGYCCGCRTTSRGYRYCSDTESSTIHCFRQSQYWSALMGIFVSSMLVKT